MAYLAWSVMASMTAQEFDIRLNAGQLGALEHQVDAAL